MGTKTKIEWTEATWNPVRGCSIVSEGCRNCYAMRQAHRSNRPRGAYEGLTRIGAHGPTWTGDVRFVPEALDYPLRLKKPHRIFVNSMSDLFHESLSDRDIEAVFGVMATAGHHVFQVLTKRPERMREFLKTKTHQSCVAAMIVKGVKTHSENGRRSRIANMPRAWPWPLPNVWLGVSCEDQKTADERIPILIQTPAAVRWISAEPLLGPIDLQVPWSTLNAEYPANGIHWVVVGGESGPGARPMHPDWVRSLRDQCAAASVPFFFKQWGAWIEIDGPRCQAIDQSPGPKFWLLDNGELVPYEQRRGSLNVYTTSLVRRVGKKAAGNTLDGRQHLEYPA